LFVLIASKIQSGFGQRRSQLTHAATQHAMLTAVSLQFNRSLQSAVQQLVGWVIVGWLVGWLVGWSRW